MIRIICGDAREELRKLPDSSVHMCVTSPPYWGLRDYKIPPTVWGGDDACDHEWGDLREIRDIREETSSGKSRTSDRFYGGEETRRFNGNHQKITSGKFCERCGAWAGALGLEPTPDLFVENIVEVFREVRRVLRQDAICWVNLGDSYNAYNGGAGPGSKLSQRASGQRPQLASGYGLRDKNLKPKDLIGIPWMVAFALRADGWWLRKDVIWAKPNPMPESAKDRPTSSHEHVFMLTKSERYFFDGEAVRENSSANPVTVARNNRADKGFVGAMDLYGTPHGQSGNGTYLRGGQENANGFRGGSYVNGTPGPRISVGNKRIKIPGAWDRGDGAHGTIHRDGRTSAEYQEAEFEAGRNIRDVWTMATRPFAEAHFATFPPELAETCIKAGTSEKGCCSACGTPWRRIIIKGEPDMAHRLASGSDQSGNYNGQSIKDHDTHGVQNASDVKRRILDGMREKTYDWAPSCKCETTTVVPAVVLDPFAGAFTSMLVADRLQRDGIGVELSDSYCEMARRRLMKDAPLLTEIAKAPQRPRLFS